MNIQLKPFAEENMPLFISWLTCDHVLPWYSPAKDWIEEVTKRNNEYDWINHYIIYAESEPIGFCQYYTYWRSEEDWHGELPTEGTYSIDYLIGDVRYLRKGCASKALTLLGEIIFSNDNAKRIIVQPEEENRASCNTLLSAGYTYDQYNQVYRLDRKPLQIN